MKILTVVTSHSQLGNTGRKTGAWLEELAAPYFAFRNAGVEVTFASPKGGPVPLDPRSCKPINRNEDTQHFERDVAAIDALAGAAKLSVIDAAAFDGMFIAGSYGSLWDLTNDRKALSLIEDMLAAKKPVALLSHASGILSNAKAPNGSPLVQGQAVTGFTNSEEAAAELAEVVPYRVEDVLKEQGANFSASADCTAHVVREGFLITGQNPRSAKQTAQALLRALSDTDAANPARPIRLRREGG